jgi:hypothetical protein
MKESLAIFQERYDYIFIDSPPVMPVSDALLGLFRNKSPGKLRSQETGRTRLNGDTNPGRSPDESFNGLIPSPICRSITGL